MGLAEIKMKSSVTAACSKPLKPNQAGLPPALLGRNFQDVVSRPWKIFDHTQDGEKTLETGHVEKLGEQDGETQQLVGLSHVSVCCLPGLW